MEATTNKSTRQPRQLGDIKGLNIPDGYTCKDCKNYLHRGNEPGCFFLGYAISEDKQCEYVPNDFALEGQESKAERSNREDFERIYQNKIGFPSFSTKGA